MSRNPELALLGGFCEYLAGRHIEIPDSGDIADFLAIRDRKIEASELEEEIAELLDLDEYPTGSDIEMSWSNEQAKRVLQILKGST